MIWSGSLFQWAATRLFRNSRLSWPRLLAQGADILEGLCQFILSRFFFSLNKVIRSPLILRSSSVVIFSLASLSKAVLENSQMIESKRSKIKTFIIAIDKYSYQIRLFIHEI